MVMKRRLGPFLKGEETFRVGEFANIRSSVVVIPALNTVYQLPGSFEEDTLDIFIPGGQVFLGGGVDFAEQAPDSFVNVGIPPGTIAKVEWIDQDPTPNFGQAPAGNEVEAEVSADLASFWTGDAFCYRDRERVWLDFVLSGTGADGATGAIIAELPEALYEGGPYIMIAHTNSGPVRVRANSDGFLVFEETVAATDWLVLRASFRDVSGGPLHPSDTLYPSEDLYPSE